MAVPPPPLAGAAEEPEDCRDGINLSRVENFRFPHVEAKKGAERKVSLVKGVTPAGGGITALDK